MRRFWVMISCVVAFVAGCSKAPPPATAPSSPVAVYRPPGVTAPVAPPASDVMVLFPSADLSLAFAVRDPGPAGPVPVREALLREGNRAIAVADGRAYAVWEIREDGVWRADPRNPGVLLRYLPAQLQDGLVWSQRSGEATVWFRLAAAQGCDQWTPACWEVTVINRGERVAFRFGAGLGVIAATADNWAEPARSFVKSRAPEGRRGAEVTAAERAALVRGLAAPPPPAPVSAATAAQFADAVFGALSAAQPGQQTLRLDLDGDGEPELLQGRLDEWTEIPLRFYHADGSSAGYPLTGRQRVSRLAFDGQRRPAFLVETEDRSVAAIAPRISTADGRVEMAPVYGWDPKSIGAPADRVSWTPDGRITVEWAMGDPARHTRVTNYTWFEDPQQLAAGVRREARSYRPTGAALRAPATPEELLQAAFVARWLGLSAELPGYFAEAETAAAFAADERVSAPDYGPGSVQIGALALPPEQSSCGPKVTPAVPQGPGPHTFVALWGGYEWCASVWGRVTFGVDGQGRPVIQAFFIDGQSAQAG